jgi:hypothetical protein
LMGGPPVELLHENGEADVPEEVIQIAERHGPGLEERPHVGREPGRVDYFPCGDGPWEEPGLGSMV